MAANQAASPPDPPELLAGQSDRQRVRRQRLFMALSTYGVVILATLLVTELGLGRMNHLQWSLFLGIAALANGVFFALVFSNANLRFRDPSLTAAQIVVSAFWGLVPLQAIPGARPIILMFYLPAFSFGMLRLTRRQYFAVTACILAAYAAVLATEIAAPRAGFSLRYELFLFALFGLLLVWFAFFGGFVTTLRQTMRSRTEALRNAQAEKDRLIQELQAALARVKQLSGLLPICASCKRIRDDQGSWRQIEGYIRSHSEVEFSHGFCPECATQLYPGSPRGPEPPP